jgi:hypothetical protein
MSEAEAFESGLESQLLRRQRSGGLGIKLVRSMSSDGADGVLCTCDPPGSQEDCGPGWPSKKLKTLITKAKRVGDMTHVAEHLSSRGELSVQTPVPSQKKKKKEAMDCIEVAHGPQCRNQHFSPHQDMVLPSLFCCPRSSP